MKIPVFVKSVKADPLWNGVDGYDPEKSQYTVTFVVQPYFDDREQAVATGNPNFTQTQDLVVLFREEPPFRAGQSTELEIPCGAAE